MSKWGAVKKANMKIIISMTWFTGLFCQFISHNIDTSTAGHIYFSCLGKKSPFQVQGKRLNGIFRKNSWRGFQNIPYTICLCIIINHTTIIIKPYPLIDCYAFNKLALLHPLVEEIMNIVFVFSIKIKIDYLAICLKDTVTWTYSKTNYYCSANRTQQ